jgi:O-acetyl-ADP-ribose deacetylase (regulator of RNase III)
MANPSFIINFPTKRHWRSLSRMEDIESGLVALRSEIKAREIKSVAMPPLGCGNGGLDWSIVRPAIEEALGDLDGVEVLLFEPAGAPDARTMPVRTPRPKMTPARALFVKALEVYSRLGYARTLLEVQKLGYFLQESGEPLRLRFERKHYGPFAHNLNKVLEELEGHFITGYGDSPRPSAEIELLPGAVDEADQLLADRPETVEHLERVSRLIEGFETPYGLELLASVHWLRAHEDPPVEDPESAGEAVRSWTKRKANLFTTRHIRLAWERLAAEGWFAEAAEPAPGPA